MSVHVFWNCGTISVTRLSQIVDDISKCSVQLAVIFAPRISNYDELKKIAHIIFYKKSKLNIQKKYIRKNNMFKI